MFAFKVSLDAISGHLDVLVDFGSHPCNSLMFPQPRWCFALNLEDIMDFCMISEEFEVFG